jgi:hypothetical protein
MQRFLERAGYSIRRPTHIAQNADGNATAAQDFVNHVNDLIKIHQISKSFEECKQT